MFKFKQSLAIYCLILTTNIALAIDDTVCIAQGFAEETATYLNLFANDQGMFKAANLKLKILNTDERVEKTNELSEYLSNKTTEYKRKHNFDECTFLVLSFNRTLKLNKKSLSDYKLLYSAYYGGSYDTHFIVKKGSKIKSLQDLENKNIRLGQFGAILAFKNMLVSENATKLNVKILDIDAVNLTDALMSNKVAMGTSYFPTMQVSLASGETEIFRKNIFTNYLNTPYPHSLILVRRSTIVENPELVKQYKEIFSNVLSVMNKSPMALGKTLRSHSVELGMKPWKVSDVQIEKGEEQYTQLKFVTANESIDYKNETTNPKDIFAKLIKELKEAKYFKGDDNLNFLF